MKKLFVLLPLIMAGSACGMERFFGGAFPGSEWVFANKFRTQKECREEEERQREWNANLADRARLKATADREMRLRAYAAQGLEVVIKSKTEDTLDKVGNFSLGFLTGSAFGICIAAQAMMSRFRL